LSADALLLRLPLPVVPVADPAALPVDPAPVLLDEPEDDTSVRMKPPRFDAELLDAAPEVAEPDVPVAVASPDRRQPLTVIGADPDRLAVDPVCPAGVCPPDCADAATASAAENTVPNMK
jgi:hypothetical protein